MGIGGPLRPLGRRRSDRELRDEDLTVDGEVEVIRALLDELGAERIGLVGGSSGRCAAIAFAARFPERVERLMLYGSYADGPSITAPSVGEAIVAAVRSHWGMDRGCVDSPRRVSSVGQEGFARFQRLASSPTRRRVFEQVYCNDVGAGLLLVKRLTAVIMRAGRDRRSVTTRQRSPLGSRARRSSQLEGSARFPWPAIPISWSGRCARC